MVDAYEARCAVTRLRIVNGGGRAEVQAAHVWAVQHGGPDTVRNGIALSSTMHWLFDRHLISLDDQSRLLVAHNRVPSELRALFHEHEGRIHLPADRSKWPSEEYVAKHREVRVSLGGIIKRGGHKEMVLPADDLGLEPRDLTC